MERYKVVPTAYLILTNGDQVLLGRRQNTGFFDDHWSLPAGHVEAGETATEAIIREAWEETGLHLSAQDLSMKICVFRRSRDRDNVEFYFEAAYDHQIVVNREPMKCAGWHFQSRSDLPDPTVPFQVHVMEAVRQGLHFLEI